MVPEKFRIRDDAKWGHPELEMAYSLMGQYPSPRKSV